MARDYTKHPCARVWVEAIEETGQPHNLVVDAASAIHFFGLDQAAAPDAGVRDGASDVRNGDGGAGGSGPSTGGAGGGAGARGGSSGSGGYRDAGVPGRDVGDTGGSGGRTVPGSSGSGGQSALAGNSGSIVDAAVDAATGGRATGGAMSTGGTAAGGRDGVGGSASDGSGGAGGSKAPSTSAGKSDGCSTTGRAGVHAWPWLLLGLACARRWSRKGRHSPSSATASADGPVRETLD